MVDQLPGGAGDSGVLDARKAEPMTGSNRNRVPWLLLVGSLVAVTAFALSWWLGVPPSEPTSILFSGLLALASLLLWRATAATVKTQERLRRWQEDRADKLDRPRPYVVGRGKLSSPSGQRLVTLEFLLSNAGAVPITVVGVEITSEEYKEATPKRATWKSLHPPVAALSPDTGLLSQEFPALVLANGISEITIDAEPKNDSIRIGIMAAKAVTLTLHFKAGGWPEDEVSRVVSLAGKENPPIRMPPQ